MLRPEATTVFLDRALSDVRALVKVLFYIPESSRGFLFGEAL